MKHIYLHQAYRYAAADRRQTNLFARNQYECLQKSLKIGMRYMESKAVNVKWPYNTMTNKKRTERKIMIDETLH